MSSQRFLAASAALALALAPSLCAQGVYVEHEAPMVKGLALAEVNGRHYLLAANLPDNCLEIYLTTSNGELSLVQRVPTGLSPVSVIYQPGATSQTGQIYVANYIGDSVTRIEFPTAGQPIATLRLTSFVGDSPTDLAIEPSTGRLQVLLASRSLLIVVDPVTLLPSPPLFPTFGLLDFQTAVFDPNDGTIPVMKEPRRLAWAGNKLHILSLRGDNAVIPGTPGTPGFRFSMLSIDPTLPLPGAVQAIRTDLGSTNMGLAVASNGDVWVAGSMARNDQIGKVALNSLATGFVESLLFRVTAPGTSGVNVERRDLNLDAGGSLVPAGNPFAIPPTGDRVSMPADVVLRENTAGAVVQAFVASLQTDRIVVLTPPAGGSTGTLKTWPATTIQLQLPALSTYSMVGPRSLLLKGTLAAAGDPGERLYCLNRFDNSISIVDPNNVAGGELAHLPLPSDATPQVVKTGRRHLYDARRTSGNHMVACASCHVDARTDGLAWALEGGADVLSVTPVPSFLVDGVTNDSGAWNAAPTWPANKELKTTQSLVGLTNHPVQPMAQFLFDNAPYHWRGDRLDFVAFNEAFVNLMRLPPHPTSPAPNGPKALGISAAEMIEFRDYINQLMYPPNPEQPYEREYTGSVGTPNSENDGSGGRRGLKEFHIHPFNHSSIFAGRSCVQCHSLPEGSSNTITLRDPTGPLPGLGLDQPLESTQIRGIQAREGRLELPTLPPLPFTPFLRTQTAGLTQGGLGNLTSDDFVTAFFGPGFDADGTPGLSVNEQANLDSVLEFVRQFDQGVAPSVGPALTLGANGTPLATAAPWLALAETQAQRGNCGVVVFRRENGASSGYYYDVVSNLYVNASTFVGVPRSALTSTPNPDDIAVFEGVHVGSERRIARFYAAPSSPPTPPVPTGITLLPTLPASHWRDVPSFTKNWAPPSGTPGPNDFVWTALTPTPARLRALREFQQSFLAVSGAFGLPGLRHEAPRRFRVSGTGIRHGAKLRLGMPMPTTVPATTPPPYANPAADTFVMEFDLHPTLDNTQPSAPLVWETTVEAAPDALYVFMAGGIFAPGVVATWAGDFSQLASLNPGAWNQYFVQVVNEGNPTPSAGFWAPLTVN